MKANAFPDAQRRGRIGIELEGNGGVSVRQDAEETAGNAVGPNINNRRIAVEDQRTRRTVGCDDAVEAKISASIFVRRRLRRTLQVRDEAQSNSPIDPGDDTFTERTRSTRFGGRRHQVDLHGLDCKTRRQVDPILRISAGCVVRVSQNSTKAEEDVLYVA